jgi:hypothetical protein
MTRVSERPLTRAAVERIAQHDQALIDQLLGALPSQYRFLSPRKGYERSTLIPLTHLERSRNTDIARSLRLRGIDIALRDARRWLDRRSGADVAHDLSHVSGDSFCFSAVRVEVRIVDANVPASTATEPHGCCRYVRQLRPSQSCRH